MTGRGRGRKARALIFSLLALGLLAGGCNTGGSSSDEVPLNSAPGPNPNPEPNPNPSPGPDPVPQGTAVPTSPAGLPALTGLSTGYRVVLSEGMLAPPLFPPTAAIEAPLPEPVGGTIIDRDAAIRLGKALFWDQQTGSDGQMACASCHFHAGADNRMRNTVNPGPNLAFETVLGPGDVLPFPFAPFTVYDVVGSSGVTSRSFSTVSLDPADSMDVCTPVTPADEKQLAFFDAGERGVTGRNTPTVIGAVFYLDNFWDGRASHKFNGQNPLGQGAVVAENSSLASQAVGPPLDPVEMSCAGRTFNGPNSLGAKLVPRTPLRNQLVDPTDSVLGPLSNAPENGLKCGFPDRLCTYADLIAAAFGTGGLSGQAAVDAFVDDFASIWGQAIQAYEATLVPDRTPYDLGLLTPAQVSGLTAYRASGCGNCHTEPEFSDASVRIINANGGPLQPKLVNGVPSDQGYHNIGVISTALPGHDPGRKGSPGGTYTQPAGPVDFNNGAFKTPSLRNVALTAPYMHNGSHATIEDVLDFYDGRNQFENPEIHPDALIGIQGDPDEIADFLRNGLTDCRVEHRLAPFDHPSLAVPNGPSLPAIGAAGDGTVCPEPATAP
jgi:cytochrome c peroxidase